MAEITSVSAGVGTSLLPQLIDLLRDAVESGASLGFWHPLSDEDAERYWHGILAGVDGVASSLPASRTTSSAPSS